MSARRSEPRRDGPIVILGAGLSGLSLACALIDTGSRRPVILVDRRRRWIRDRTWCTWQTGALRFSDCVDARWRAWEMSAGGESVISGTRRHPYVHIDAQALYDRALERIDRAPHVELISGESVLGLDPGDPRVVVTAHRRLRAGVVFDALGARSPLAPAPVPAQTELAQRFHGWEVETDAPAFDPQIATLMDVRDHCGVGVSFFYVLPFSRTRALVEHTSIEAPDAAPVDRRARLEAELARRGAREWRILRAERAVIPMQSAVPAPSGRSGVHRLGTAAGVVRPSSGYAFSRIQRHTDAVVAALEAGRRPPTHVAALRHDVLDRVFLTALARHPEPERLFLASARAGADAFARFMTDASGPLDEARLLAVMPLGTMARAAGETLLASPARREYRQLLVARARQAVRNCAR